MAQKILTILVLDFIKMLNFYENTDTDIGRALWDAVYINDRLLGQGKFINKSILKIGSQSLPYRIGHTFATISFDWVGRNVSDNALSRELKKQFFKYYIDKP